LTAHSYIIVPARRSATPPFPSHGGLVAVVVFDQAGLRRVLSTVHRGMVSDGPAALIKSAEQGAYSAASGMTALARALGHDSREGLAAWLLDLHPPLRNRRGRLRCWIIARPVPPAPPAAALLAPDALADAGGEDDPDDEDDDDDDDFGEDDDDGETGPYMDPGVEVCCAPFAALRRA
jgi:hypothetical protein